MTVNCRKASVGVFQHQKTPGCSYKIPTGWYIPHDILWVLPRYRAIWNTRDVRIAVNEQLWPLQRVVIPIMKVGTQKKLSIASQRRVKYRLAVWAGYHQFPLSMTKPTRPSDEVNAKYADS
jgi:hypothetical protein